MGNRPEQEPSEPGRLYKAVIIICMTIMAFALLAMIGEMPNG